MKNSGLTESGEGKDVSVREETRASEHYIKPSVNIIETAEGLTLIADLPGAAKESLDVNIDKGILTVNAAATSSISGRPVYTEFDFTHYYRQFTIPEALDNEHAKAEFINGVLTLKVPMAEAAKPRKIEIKAG